MAGVLVVQNARAEGPGNLGRLLSEDGFDVTTVHAGRERIPAGPAGDLLVILGGPQGANDGLQHLRDEQELIRLHVAGRRPVLGVCLGSQLIARAFGAPVTRGPAAEAGFYHDLVPDGGPALFSGFASPFSAFHWHRDAFGLPGGAVRLAHSGGYANQAFLLGTAVGVQFHLEVDREMINLWLDNAGAGRAGGMPGADLQKIRGEIDAGIPAVESNMARFYKNFKSQFRL